MVDFEFVAPARILEGVDLLDQDGLGDCRGPMQDCFVVRGVLEMELGGFEILLVKVGSMSTKYGNSAHLVPHCLHTLATEFQRICMLASTRNDPSTQERAARVSTRWLRTSDLAP